jgi:hypothetical protein
VVDNTQDEDWVDVGLTLVAGLPVSFVHDLYTPRYIKRPEVRVQETTGVLPPIVEEGVPEVVDSMLMEFAEAAPAGAGYVGGSGEMARSLALEKSVGRVRVARSAVSSAPAQVRERRLGDLFVYEIEHPVTIRRNQSALVPIVLREFQGRPVLLYNKANRAENPMRCVEFENTTGLTLEGGPVTVLEGGDYVGEAMLETSKPGETRLVPFAVELGVFVLDNLDSHEDAITRVVVHRGTITLHYGWSQKTTYAFRNKSDAEAILVLEHPRGGSDWGLFETPVPEETTEHHWRFRLTLAPGKTTPFVVRQRRPIATSHALNDLSDHKLGLYIQRRYFEPEAERVIKQVIARKQQATRHDEQVKRLQQELAQIHKDQERVRENLKSLGDRASEKELRERFVRGLNAQEDRLEQIRGEIASQEAELEACRRQVDDLLGSLEFEKAV